MKRERKRTEWLGGRDKNKKSIVYPHTHTHTHTLVDDGRRGPLVGGRRRRSEERK
jgi:hypothetical protein